MQCLHQLTISVIGVILSLLQLTIKLFSPTLAKALPSSYYQMAAKLGRKSDKSMTKYIVCQGCGALHLFSEGDTSKNQKRKQTNKQTNKQTGFLALTTDEQGEQVSKLCHGSRFPSGPSCKTPLLNKKRGKWVTDQIFFYRQLSQMLHNKMSDPHYVSLVNCWRQREADYEDIYDFPLWREHATKGILKYDNNLALMLHLDFFNPFGRSRKKYSIGGIYVTNLNLPRKIRFKKENILVLAIVPGPKEPKLHLNPFMQLFTEELKKLDQGFAIQRPELGPLFYRARLLLITADLPALRKLLSFCGHGALLGCSKCWKTAVRKGDRNDWSGDHDAPQRTHGELRQAALAYKQVRNASQDSQHTAGHFARWNPLFDLGYFDSVRFHVVDPMHCLFLGIVKAHLSLIFTQVIPEELDSVEEKIKVPFLSQSVPLLLHSLQPSLVFLKNASNQMDEKYGRMPEQLTKHLSSAKAVELKNFALYFSDYVFFSLLPGDQLVCWMTLVRFLRLICSPSIEDQLLEHAKKLLSAYLSLFEHLYPDHVTINFHMVWHVIECCADLGPISGFWCFAFERLNGELQKIVTNGVSIELQMLNRILLEEIVRQGNLAVHPAFSNFLLKSMGNTEDATLAAHVPRARETKCPSPDDAIKGNEPLDGEFLGAEKMTILSSLDFNRVVELTRTSQTNCIKLFKRVRVGRVQIHSLQWKAKNPCYVALNLLVKSRSRKVIGSIEYFFEIGGSPSFKLAVLHYFRECYTKDNMTFVRGEKPTEREIVPISRILSLVTLIPMENNAQMVVYLPEI